MGTYYIRGADFRCYVGLEFPKLLSETLSPYLLRFGLIVEYVSRFPSTPTTIRASFCLLLSLNKETPKIQREKGYLALTKTQTLNPKS